MNTIFNLDLNKKDHPTSFAYQVPSDTQEMYFRIIENDYVIDYSSFRQLSLRFEFGSGTIYTNTVSSTTTYQNEKVIAYKIPSNYLNKTGDITVTPTVRLSNKTVILSSFKLYLYDGQSNSCANTNMRNVLTSIYSYNHMLKLYYDAIKRDQINKPNGVVGLNSNGDIPIEYFPTTLANHITDKLIDTKTKTFPDENGLDIGIHGLKLDDKWRLRYYDAEDLAWRVANSIYGGDFGVPNKSAEWNISGGSWGTPSISAGTFTKTSDRFFDGGNFKDSLSGEVDANFIDSGVETGENIFGGTFK